MAKKRVFLYSWDVSLVSTDVAVSCRQVGGLPLCGTASRYTAVSCHLYRHVCGLPLELSRIYYSNTTRPGYVIQWHCPCIRILRTFIPGYVGQTRGIYGRYGLLLCYFFPSDIHTYRRAAWDLKRPTAVQCVYKHAPLVHTPISNLLAVADQAAITYSTRYVYMYTSK